MTDFQATSPALLTSPCQDPLSSPIEIRSRKQPTADEPYEQRHTFASSTSSPMSVEDAATASPPRSSTSLPTEYDARLGSHVQHFRVYGLSDDEAAHVREEDQSGPAFVSVALPSPTTVWTRGQPAEIHWSVVDPSVTSVRIELMEHGCSGITVIAQETANSGAFAYGRVPWGMPCGSRYFLRITDCSAPARFLTTGFFTIDSAP